MSVATRILVVDDEPDVELLINQQFRRQIRAGEFTLSFARDGEQALNVLQKEAGFDLMLLDINMPVMDGLTLLARLSELQAQVRAIIVSAYGDMPNIRTAMNRGAFDFVLKPIDMACSAQQAVRSGSWAFSVPKRAAFLTIISVRPMTALSGVRSSWLILARKCDRLLRAFSAAREPRWYSPSWPH
jgi:CheY-like chemotaxis protein